MERYGQTLRAFRVLHYLEITRTGLRISDIHKRLEEDKFVVSIKTVERDLELLQLAHFPIESDRNGAHALWKMAPFAELGRNIQFSYQEIFALYIARKSLDHLKGSPLHDKLESLFVKLEKVLGTNSEAFEEMSDNLIFRPQITWHTSVAPLILDTVYHALEEGHPLKISYRSEAGENAGRFVERTVGPECLYFAQGGIYLIAKDLTKNEPRTYALGRINEAIIDKDNAYDKEGLSPEKMFKDSFGILGVGEPMAVEISVDNPISSYVAERRWHESQQTIRTETGITLKMNVRINDEFARWVLSLGPSAVVIEPKVFADRVAHLATEIAKKYQKKSAA